MGQHAPNIIASDCSCSMLSSTSQSDRATLSGSLMCRVTIRISFYCPRAVSSYPSAAQSTPELTPFCWITTPRWLVTGPTFPVQVQPPGPVRLDSMNARCAEEPTKTTGDALGGMLSEWFQTHSHSGLDWQMDSTATSTRTPFRPLVSKSPRCNFSRSQPSPTVPAATHSRSGEISPFYIFHTAVHLPLEETPLYSSLLTLMQPAFCVPKTPLLLPFSLAPGSMR